jgi:hypothetical protein
MAQSVLEVERIKQYAGLVQVTRAVKLSVPGKHFPALTPAEQKEFYSGTAVEYAERHKFERHYKAWGNAGIFPGIRFICDSDAIDDPDNKGYWTTLSLWKRQHRGGQRRRCGNRRQLGPLIMALNWLAHWPLHVTLCARARVLHVRACRHARLRAVVGRSVYEHGSAMGCARRLEDERLQYIYMGWWWCSPGSA